MIRLTDEEIELCIEALVECEVGYMLAATHNNLPLREINQHHREYNKNLGCMIGKVTANAQLEKVENMGLLRHDADVHGHCKPDCRACEALLEEVK